MRALLLTFLLLFSGCATFQSSARQVVYQSGVVVAAVDSRVAPAYGQAAREALGASQTLEEYEARMAPWNAAEEALRATWAALKAIEVALDAYQAGSEGKVIPVVLRLLVALRHLGEALEAVLPEEVDQVVGLLRYVEQLLPQTGAQQ